MLIPSYPNFEFPTGGYTNGDILYESLGSFWTQIFSDRGVIRGYTLGQAEELMQRYYDLIGVVNSFSCEDTPLFHTVKWLPIRIKKSDFKRTPLSFRASGDGNSVVGAQPSTDHFYAGTVFKFGLSRIPVTEEFTAPLNEEVKEVYILANRVFAPSMVLVNNMDFKLENDRLVVNADLFSNPLVAKYKVFDDSGVPVVYSSYDYTIGQWVEQQDEEIVLWAYHAEIDSLNLYLNHGYLFKFQLENTQQYKDILTSTVNLFVDGPTVSSVLSITSAFLGIKPVVEATEIIEEVYTHGATHVVVTDKNVYKIPSAYTLATHVIAGAEVYAGDPLTTAIEYFDNVVLKNWWQTKYLPYKVAQLNSLSTTVDMSLPGHLFIGDYAGALIFKNTTLTAYNDVNGTIVFPVYGEVEDVVEFHNYINDPVRRVEVCTSLGLNPLGSSSVQLNPLDFVFNNFLKTNTALIKFSFLDLEQTRLFMRYFYVMRDCLPPNLYLMFFFDFNLTQDEISDLNGSTPTWIRSGADITLTSGAVSIDTSIDDYFRTLITKTSHGLVNNDTIRFWTQSGRLPRSISDKTVYTVIDAQPNTFHLSLDGTLVSMLDAGAGTFYIYKVSNTWSYNSTTPSIVNADGSDTTGRIPTDAYNLAEQGDAQKLFYLANMVDLVNSDSSNVLTNTVGYGNTTSIPMDTVSGAAIVDGAPGGNMTLSYMITDGTCYSSGSILFASGGMKFTKYLKVGDFIVHPLTNKKAVIKSVGMTSCVIANAENPAFVFQDIPNGSRLIINRVSPSTKYLRHLSFTQYNPSSVYMFGSSAVTATVA